MFLSFTNYRTRTAISVYTFESLFPPPPLRIRPKKKDTFGKSDPFVECFWRGALCHTTAVVQASLDPEFNHEAFTVGVPIHAAAAPSAKHRGGGVLVCDVFDSDAFAKG